MSTSADHQYYVPEGSRWPVIAVLGMFTLFLGFILLINDVGPGQWIMLFGGVVLAYLLFGWFGDVIEESSSGKYNEQVDASFRQGMIWFITSEVFFFLTFFGCLFYLRTISGPWLGGEGHLGKSNLLWEGFQHTWPLIELPDATRYVPAKEAMGPLGIPLYNTLILLSSGATITWAHWGLKQQSRPHLLWGLVATIALGVIFFALQAYEYGLAYAEMGLTLNSGIYGSTFYMLTGFHGLHVTIGVIMLMVILVRSIKGHFSPHNHFAFEAVAWYWHFVDVVWLGLYVFVYWL